MSEKKIRMELETASEVLDSAYRGIIITDKDGIILYVNPSFLKIFKHTGQESVVGRNINDLFPLSNGIQFSDMSLMISKHSGLIDEFSALTIDGKMIFIEAYCSTIWDKKGRDTGRIISLVDITERKEQESMLRIQHDLALSLSGVTIMKEAVEQLLTCILILDKIDAGAFYTCDTITGRPVLADQQGFLNRTMVDLSRYLDSSLDKGKRFSELQVITPEENDFREIWVDDEPDFPLILIQPIVQKHKNPGILVLASHEKGTVTGSLKLFLETVSTMFGEVITRIESRNKIVKMIINQLTERERGIIILLSEGNKRREIARKLDIAESTYDKHLKNIKGKLKMSERFDIIKFAMDYREYF